MLTGRSITCLPSRQGVKANAFLGPGLILLSALIFAVMDGLIKVLSSMSLSVWDIGFYRFWGGLLILLALFPENRNPFKAHRLKVLILRGITGCIAFLALTMAIQMIPISTAMVLFYAYPAFATLFSAWVFKEQNARRGIVWAITAFLGVVLFFDARLQGGLLGQCISLIGAAFAGLAISLVKKARETDGSVLIYIHFCLAGSLICTVPFALNPHIPVSTYEWIALGAFVVGSIIAQLLMNEGFRYCGSAQGSILLTFEMIFVALWGFICLKEAVTWHFWVGGGIILASIVAISLQKSASEAVPGASRRDGLRT